MQQMDLLVDKLDKKGYSVKIAYKASTSKVFKLSNILHDLIEENVLNDENKDKIYKILKFQDYEETAIIFKENYKFKDIPKGFQQKNSNIFYHLSFLKNDSYEYKSLLELYNENEISFKELENWVNNLERK